MADELGKTPAVKPKIDLKRVKKKPNLNISKRNLKSIATPKKFSFLNMSVQKQSLRANNRALAQSLSKARLELRNLSAEHQDLKVFNQDLIQELNKLKRLVGIKDEELEEEVQKRMEAHVKDIKLTLEDLSQNIMQSCVIVGTLDESCKKFSRRSTASSRAESLGNVSNVSDGTLNKLSLSQRSSAATRNRKQNSIMMKYLSNADEFSPPPTMESPTAYSNKANMSVIAEQSFVGEEPKAQKGFLSSIHQRISPVSESPVEASAVVSRLPQRVPKGKRNLDGQASDKQKTAPCGFNDENITSNRPKKASEKRNADCLDPSSESDMGILDIDSDFVLDLVQGTPISDKDKPEQLDAKKKQEKEVSQEKIRKNMSVVEKESGKAENCNTKHKASKGDKKKISSKTNKDTLKVKSTSSSNTNKSPKSRAIVVPDIIVEPGMTANEDQFNPFKPSKTLLRSPHRGFTPSPTPSPASPVKKINSVQLLASLAGPVQKENDDEIHDEAPNFGGDEKTIYFDSEMELTAVCDFSKLLQTSKNQSKKSPYASPVLGLADQPDGVANSKGSDKSSSGKGESSQDAASIAGKADSQSKENLDTATIEMRNKKPGVFTFTVGRKETDGTRKPVPEKPARSRVKKQKNATPEKEERKVGDDRDMFNFGDRTPTMPLEKILQSKNVYDLSMNDSSIAPTSSLSNFRKILTKDGKEAKTDKQSKNEHIYSVPLKDSPDEKRPVKASSRSKSNTRSKSASRSKSKSRQEEDSGDEWVPESRGRSRSRSKVKRKNKSEDDDDQHDDADKLNKAQGSEKSSSTQSKDMTAAKVNDNDVNIYSVPLKKGSPDAKKEIAPKGRSMSKSNTRSKSITRSKSKSRVNNDSDEEVPTERKSRSRSKKVNDNVDVADQIDDSTGDEKPTSVGKPVGDVYHEPLKGSPDSKSKQVTRRKRSQSSTRSKSKMPNEETSEDEAVPLGEVKKSRSRVSRRETTETDGEKDSSPPEDNLKLSSSNLPAKENSSANNKPNGQQKESSTDKGTNGPVYYETLKDSPAEKPKKVSQRTRSKSRTRSKPSRQQSDSDDEFIPVRKSRSKKTIVVETDDDSSCENDIVGKSNQKLSGAENSEGKRNQKISDAESGKSSVSDVTLKDNALESTEKTEKNQTNSTKKHEDKSDDELIAPRKSRSRTEKAVKDMADEQAERVYYEPLRDDSPSENLKKVTHRKRSKSSARSKFTPLEVSDSGGGVVSESKETGKDKESNNANDEVGARKTDDDGGVPEKKKASKKLLASEDPDEDEPLRLSTKTPALTKSSTKCSSKSTASKSTRKRKAEPKTEEATPRRKKGKTELFEGKEKEVVDAPEEDSSTRLSTKTPAVAKSTKKASSKSTAGKSSKKREMETKESNNTPKRKKDKDLSEHKENTPTGLSDFELLKRRLTMMTSRTSKIEEDGDLRKTSNIRLGDDNDDDNEGESEGMVKSRRSKPQVSYVPKPLNAKLRRGDSLFDGQGSKASKADEMRLQLAKKTSVLREYKN